jgi:hypothetical protein
MADIKVQDILINNIPGIDLFNDSENFMVELNDESEQVLGGCRSDTFYCSARMTCNDSGDICRKDTFYFLD